MNLAYFCCKILGEKTATRQVTLLNCNLLNAKVNMRLVLFILNTRVK